MKAATLALVLCFVIGCVTGYFLGRDHARSRLSVCYNDLAWAVDRGVTAEAKLNECRQLK